MFYYIFRGGITFILGLLGRCHVHGQENIPLDNGLIIVANHVNLLDSPILGVTLRRKLYFMAKEELFQSRITGWLVKQFGAFPVAKGKLDRRAGKIALDLLTRGEALFLYPEGKRSADGQLGPAYSGAAILALRSGVPILPVGISGTSQLVGKWWWLRRPKIDIHIGRVFRLDADAGAITGREHSQAITQSIMLRIAGQLPAEYRGIYRRRRYLKPEIIKADSLGFCMGVRRAIEGINTVASRRGGIETLGALVHNQQVLRQLAERGVIIVDDAADLTGDTVVISAHGVSPQVMHDIASRGISVIDTTCPFVKRAQTAARKLAQAGFYTLVFGDVKHPEVKGILGWAEGKGLATTQVSELEHLAEIPLKLGILSQTTQITAAFNAFVKDVVDIALRQDGEIRIIDTLCHDIRRRQADTLTMARKSDLVLVIGGRNSANTRHLYELCSTVSKTYLIETAAEIEPIWLAGRRCVGVTAGASTDDQTIDQVVARLETLAETDG